MDRKEAVESGQAGESYRYKVTERSLSEDDDRGIYKDSLANPGEFRGEQRVLYYLEVQEIIML